MDIAAQAKAKLAVDTARGATLQAAWQIACDKIEAHMLARRPKPRSFEVHHMTETARQAFLEAFCEGKSDDVCVLVACERIGVAS
jgi:hypothetical protein